LARAKEPEECISVPAVFDTGNNSFHGPFMKGCLTVCQSRTKVKVASPNDLASSRLAVAFNRSTQQKIVGGASTAGMRRLKAPPGRSQ